MNLAERIYVASTLEHKPGARLAAEALARRIEDDIAALGLTPGCPLGSLRELSERYKQGRSVIREAVSLLERRGLGLLRPGPRGGFILCKPTRTVVAMELADYFASTGVDTQARQDAHNALALLRSQETRDTQAVVSLLANSLQQLADTSDNSSDIESVAAGNKRSNGLLAGAIARRLAVDIARTDKAGARLGSEWDLCERFNVGRLTLRRAIRLLQDRGLVECRRGRGNGVVISDRRAPGVMRQVLAYFIGEQLDAQAAGTILFQLNVHVPALAVSRGNAEQRQQLHEMLLRLECRESFERIDLLSLVHLLAKLANSPIIDLFSRCLAAYEARFHPSLVERLPLSAQAAYFKLVSSLLERLPQGDAATPDWALQASSRLMMEMSLSRPL